MVLKPNSNYQPEQGNNMQYPPAGSPPQGPPYGEGNQQQNPNQWQAYPPSNNPVSSPPVPSAPSLSRGESSSYYGYGNTPQPGSHYPGPQPLPEPYQQPYGSNYSQQQQYPPQGQYNSQQQYPPPAQGPYGGSNFGSPPPVQQPYSAYPPTSEQQGAYPPVPRPQGAFPPGNGPQTDEERGIMGAVAGAAAGGYAGHKLHHGVIGTLGGAYAGHKLEDKWKEHHNKPPTPVQQPNQPPVQQPNHGGAQFAGNFSASSNRISLDRDYDLIAECTDVNGQQKMSSISLNQVLTNDDGHFKWVDAGGNFGGSARNVHLIDGGKGLEAELCRCDGTWNQTRIHLDERIGNEDGNLKLV